MEPIRFDAEVYKVQTLVDGGVRVTLNLPETAIMQMGQLAECQRFGVVINITCKPIILTNFDDETKKEPKTKGARVDSGGPANRRDKR